MTSDLISDVFLSFSDQTRAEESAEYLRTLHGEFQWTESICTWPLTRLLTSAICLSMDNTHKVGHKTTVMEKNKPHTKIMKGGILSAINEGGEIISWVCT